jgi:hypothetical protein
MLALMVELSFWGRKLPPFAAEIFFNKINSIELMFREFHTFDFFFLCFFYYLIYSW